MTDIKTKSMYANASVIICGGVCLVRVITQIMLKASDWSDPAIPGLVFMSDLCYPILFAWIGMLLRGWKPESQWSVQLVVLFAAFYGLYRYCDWTADHWHIVHFNFALMALGYLIPPRSLKLEGEKAGWSSLIMLILSVFCFTAVSVAKQRLLWGDLMPEHQDMEKLIEALLWMAEPLLGLISAYFVTLFAFSSTAQDLGSLRWIRLFVVLVCILSFILAIKFLLMLFHCWVYMAGYVYYSPLLSVLIQPVAVYLIIAVYRKSFKRAETGEKLSWKEAFKLPAWH